MEDNYNDITEAIQSLQEYLEIEESNVLDNFEIEKFIDNDSDGVYYIATPKEIEEGRYEKHLIVPSDTIDLIIDNYIENLIDNLDLYISDEYLYRCIDLTDAIDMWKIQSVLMDNVIVEDLLENHFSSYEYIYTDYNGNIILNERN